MNSLSPVQVGDLLREISLGPETLALLLLGVVVAIILWILVQLLE